MWFSNFLLEKRSLYTYFQDACENIDFVFIFINFGHILEKNETLKFLKQWHEE